MQTFSPNVQLVYFFNISFTVFNFNKVQFVSFFFFLLVLCLKIHCQNQGHPDFSYVTVPFKELFWSPNLQYPWMWTYRAFPGITKWGWVSNPMTDILKRQVKFEHRYRGRNPWDNIGKNWSHMSTNQETQRLLAIMKRGRKERFSHKDFKASKAYWQLNFRILPPNVKECIFIFFNHPVCSIVMENLGN